ncbi:glycerol-3-phosphate dehydrogenase, putative [Theileria equi strain WA]|uniref:Glycerol-3-phosphate dehydrogenase [NAD(+)] n=1 Tax=Theileria equi strain WA TaxID=1537102 RepID=L0AXK1_THEEQ|nr:glycerol-3-phosphate dehydrogenase, putative [Theileria equi strain WA]AFZ80295.1 glycerol-3-phosphate dehydrogenase, putative [Theileria equi strain WA]|eukprot:XP_004829961.1 glycerol-3-phosphate dehydrogenase, putative [Theileria equi strain WA]
MSVFGCICISTRTFCKSITQNIFSTNKNLEIYRFCSKNLYSTEIGPNLTKLVYSTMAPGKKVTVVGCGNWGTAAAKTISENAAKFDLFDDTVRMWVLEEQVDGMKLSEMINTLHENKKYLPSIKLPHNLVAVPDLNECVKDADLFIFVIPHQFVKSTAAKIKASGNLKPDAVAISLIKGVAILDNKPVLISDIIEEELGIPCAALSGANVATCIANEEFSEATIGCADVEQARVWQRLFDRPYFKISCIKDPTGIQIYGAIKNVVALSAGFCDGLGLGSNTKAAIIRIGLKEIHRFAEEFFPAVSKDVVFESAGVADLITTCIGGRNVRCAAEFARHKGARPWEEIEKEFLNGQKLQGVSTCAEVHEILKACGKAALFPLFEVTHKISFEAADPSELIKAFSTEKLEPVL